VLESVLKRSIDRRCVSSLLGASACPSNPSTKGYITALHPPQRLSAIPSKRCNHSTHAASNAPYFTTSSCSSSYSHGMTHHVHPQSCKQKYVSQPQRFLSDTPSSNKRSCIENTPLDNPEGAALMKGLDIHTVPAEDDGHPLAVFTIEDSDTDIDNNTGEQKQKIPVLLLHGRTWSSIPVYHLNGRDYDILGPADDGRNRSLIQAIYNTKHIQPYMMDFRGFGGTPKDDSGFVDPLRCVSDAVSVLNWIREKHSDVDHPSLLGWSHGSLIAQIVAQRHSDALSKLILYGSTYNPNFKYSLPTPQSNQHAGYTDHEDFPLSEMATRNQYDHAMEDFTNFGMVSGGTSVGPPLTAKLFAEAALATNPMKVQWCNLHQLNECHPSLVKVPAMVITGDQDPYAPKQTQAELFTNLGGGVDRVWSIIANADHAIHLSDERHRLVENINSFLGTGI